jgi:hypothetical protein
MAATCEHITQALTIGDTHLLRKATLFVRVWDDDMKFNYCPLCGAELLWEEDINNQAFRLKEPTP